MFEQFSPFVSSKSVHTASALFRPWAQALSMGHDLSSWA